jgi:hypothetical protein
MHEIRMKAFIKKAYSRKDTERYYLLIAKKMKPLVKMEKALHKQNEKFKKQHEKLELKKKLVKKKIVKKYKVTDRSSFIVEFN